jgi:hypothetical protein
MSKTGKKELLAEGTVRRFMRLANIPALADGFVQKLNEDYGSKTVTETPGEVKSGGMAKKGGHKGDEDAKFGSSKSGGKYPHKFTEISPDHSKNLSSIAPKHGVLEEAFPPKPEDEEEPLPGSEGGDLAAEPGAPPPVGGTEMGAPGEGEMPPEMGAPGEEMGGEGGEEGMGGEEKGLDVAPDLAAKILGAIAHALGVPIDIETGGGGGEEEEPGMEPEAEGGGMPPSPEGSEGHEGSETPGEEEEEEKDEKGIEEASAVSAGAVEGAPGRPGKPLVRECNAGHGPGVPGSTGPAVKKLAIRPDPKSAGMHNTKPPGTKSKAPGALPLEEEDNPPGREVDADERKLNVENPNKLRERKLDEQKKMASRIAKRILERLLKESKVVRPAAKK